MPVLTEKQIDLVWDAIDVLDYEDLAADKDSAIAKLEAALLACNGGQSPVQARYQLYPKWANLAGCVWGSRGRSARFSIDGTELHALVKTLIPDGPELSAP